MAEASWRRRSGNDMPYLSSEMILSNSHAADSRVGMLRERERIR